MERVHQILFKLQKRSGLQPRRSKSSRKAQGRDTGGTVLSIYVQNIRTKKFSVGSKKWSAKPEEAYAFPNTVSAIHFCEATRAQEPGVQLMIHFGSPDALNPQTSKEDESGKQIT